MTRFTLFTILICSVLFEGALAFCNSASPLKSIAALRTNEFINNKLDTTKIAAPTCFFIKLKQSSPQCSPTALHYDSNSDNNDIGGMKRGMPLFVSVLLVCVWYFTIPPEFRRTRYCGSNYCMENRVECNNCKTVGELQKEIQDYYRNGGGIQWDFSIDPETRAEFDSKFK